MQKMLAAIPLDPTTTSPHRNEAPAKGHLCASYPAYKADARAVACPVCEVVIPTRRGTDPNADVYEHIQAGCKPPETKKAYTNACAFKVCDRRELVPIRCGKCGSTFCIRHRNELDHACPAASKPGSAKGSPKSQPAKTAAAAAAAAAKRAAGKRGSGQSGKAGAAAKDCNLQ
ncbi:hypothetical protein HDU88_008055 [Geranomyces variabilis]|nr:hypothetical protein HDU88_008055 [Geranomyces variabilis]